MEKLKTAKAETAKKIKNTNQRNSIKTKIISAVLLLLIASSILVGVISSVLSYISSDDLLRQTVRITSDVASEQVAAQIASYANAIIDAGMVARLSNPDTSVEEKEEIIQHRVEKFNFQRGRILDEKGVNIADGTDFSDREYYQASIKGETFVSDPLISKVTGEKTIIISAPLWENGIPNTKVVGVLYFVPQEEFLNDIVRSISLGKAGSAYILDSKGNIAAHTDSDRVMTENKIELAKTDSDYASSAAIEAKMIKGEVGEGKCTFQGITRMLGYSQIANSNNWSIAVYADYTEFMLSTYVGILVTIIIIVVFIIAGIIIANRTATRIANPIINCSNRITLLSQGDLTSTVDEVHTGDEVEVLRNSLAETVNRLGMTISDVSSYLGEISSGNLTVSSSMNYEGDFLAISDAMANIKASLSDTIGQITTVSTQVAEGSSQVSSAAQTIAEGASDQSSSVEELTASLDLVSQQIQKNSESAQDAYEKTAIAGAGLTECNAQMDALAQAMDEISVASKGVAKILDNIESIASQTNLLSLNAAIEAARAGDAGKGFAVVAEEVRELSDKSAEAVKETSILIDHTLKAVERGTSVAHNTATAVTGVMASAGQVVTIVDEISSDAKKQAHSIAEISKVMDQVASVVENNSAMAQESTATSEELSGQAQLLQEMVSQFKL